MSAVHVTDRGTSGEIMSIPLTGHETEICRALGDLQLVIGQDAEGRWILAEDRKRCGAVFVSRKAALKFAASELVPAAWTALQQAMEEKNWERAKFISGRLRPHPRRCAWKQIPLRSNMRCRSCTAGLTPKLDCKLTPITEDTAKAIREALARL